MANTVLTPSIIAREALMILENNCVMGGLVYRGYESEFGDTVNGYSVGETISVRRPADFTVRDGRTASIQDVVEGKFPMTVDKEKGVDFNFTSRELSLSIKELSDRVIRPAMIQVANQIDRDLTALYANVYNWVGTPSGTIDSFADFAKAPERLGLLGVPTDERAAVLSPPDHWGFLGTQTSLYVQDIARDAFRRGTIGMIAGIDTYESQNIATHVRGTNETGSVISSQSTTYALTKDSNTMSLETAIKTGEYLKAGDVFTINAVYAVNPVTKATQSYLQQFVVVSTITSTATTGTTTLTITPPIITTGAFQTVSAAPGQSATITVMGAATSSWAQNLVFHRNAFALVMVPKVSPPGAVSVARESYKGYSVRVIPYYSGDSDISNWRLDVLYGVKCLDPRLAVRINGT